MKHIEFETLLKYFEGLLPVAVERETAAHLNLCRSCAGRSGKLGTFLDYVRSDDYEPVPQALTANLLNVYRPKKSAPKKESFVKKLTARLVFDDWQFALNERLILSDTRQLLYRSDRFEIDLRLDFAGEKCQVSGQVFPDCRNGVAELFSEETSEKAMLNGNCEFVFMPVKNGLYRLRIETGEVSVEIPNISLLA